MKSEILHYKNVELTKEQLKEVFAGRFTEGEPVYIKVHFGEPGNSTAFTPEIVKPYTEALHELGLETILWDCPVFYESPRNSKAGYEKVVEEKGYQEISGWMICDDYDTVELHDGKTAEMSKILAGVENILVLTHVKGHGAAGFGATIKNIGIGAMAPKTKGLVHGIEGEVTEDTDWTINQDRLGEVVGKAYERMVAAKTLFVNIIRDVTQHCDCTAETTPIIAPDLGVLVSDNLVAVDQAALDMVNAATGRNVFLEENEIDPQAAIDATAKYSGLGKGYEVIEK